MAITFFFHGGLTAAAFLQKSPLPSIVEEETTIVTTTAVKTVNPANTPKP